jgi:transposase
MSTKAQDEVVVISPSQHGRRRTYSAAEKQRILAEVAEPGASVNSVARRWRISPSVVFRWRKLHEEGGLRGLHADEPVVPESEVKQLRVQVRELQRLLGKKTMETEILKDALELARSKKLLLPSSSSKPEGGE